MRGRGSRLRSVVVLVILVSVAAPAMARQIQQPLDLASLDPGSTQTVPARPGDEFQFTVINRVAKPEVTYLVTIERDFVPIDALTLAGFRGASPPPPPVASAERAALRPDCPEIEAAARKALRSAADEKAVRTAMATLRSKTPSDCMSVVDAAIQQLTTQAVEGGPYDVQSGELLRVTVTRSDNGDTWIWVFTTGNRGEWRMTYGFTFVPNEDDRFVTRPQANSKFKIVSQEDHKNLDFVPSVLFTWLLGKKRAQDWVFSWTVGLGWDLEQLVVFVGPSWTYNENVNLTFGLAIHQQTRLLGRYSEDGDSSIVGEALDADQLTESTFGPNAYVGVGFRFDSDVHARRAALEKQTAEAQAAAQKALAQKKAAEAAEAKKRVDETREACLEKADADLGLAREKCKGVKDEDLCGAEAKAEAAKARLDCQDGL